MFHDDRTWCVRPEGTPEAVALQVTRRTWPACTAFEAGGYCPESEVDWQTRLMRSRMESASATQANGLGFWLCAAR